MQCRAHIVHGVAVLHLLAASLLMSQEQGPGQTHRSVHRSFREQYGSFEQEHPVVPSPDAASIRPLAGPQRSASLKKEVFGYLPYWFRDRWYQLDYTLVSTVAYFSGEAASDGSIGTTHGWPRYAGDPSADLNVVNMINAAHARGTRVVLCITNFTGSEITALVSTPAARAALCHNALTLVMAGNGDGVNINFEGIDHASRDSLTAFMKALADTFHTRIPGSQVSCAPTDFDLRYNGGDWDLPALNPFVDLFFVQGYGYAYGGSSTSGPIGLLPNTSLWGALNITTLIDNVVLPRIGPEKVVLGLPHYGYRWATASENPKAATQSAGVAFYYPDALGYVSTYGRQWDATALNPWYRYQASGQWYQGWYDDPESMSHKYQFALDRNLKGIGMWSLGMEGSNHDIWDVVAMYFSDSSIVLRSPKQPTLAVVGDTSFPGEGRAYVRWFANTEPYLGGYRLFASNDTAQLSGSLLLDETALDRNATSAILGALSLDSTIYVRLVAVDTSHTKVSDTSDTYGTRLGVGTRYLVVDGFDRTTGSYNASHHAFAATYGKAVSAHERKFDSAAKRTINTGIVQPSSYAGMIWFCGDQSTADRTFMPSEQESVKTFLQAGGRLFVTGSEIGYDLGRATSPDYAPAFYTGYLKATYVGDKATGSSFTGVAGSAFQGVSGQFGQTYPEDYPDYITPTGGSIAALNYNGTQTAGVQYAGTFGSGAVPGKLVYLGFAFETIGSAATRDTLVARILDFFESTTDAPPAAPSATPLPSSFALSQNFPNPFNPATCIEVTVPVNRGGHVRLTVYDLLGRAVATLIDDARQPGRYVLSFDATGLASGVYLYRLEAGSTTIVKHMLYLK
jgi:spore germination protein YaaH